MTAGCTGRMGVAANRSAEAVDTGEERSWWAEEDIAIEVAVVSIHYFVFEGA